MVLRRLTNYLPASIASIFYVWIGHKARDPLSSLSSATKAATYGAMVQACGALLGFGLTAVAILFGISPHTRLAVVVAYGGRLLRLWLTGALLVLAVCTFGFAILIAVDHTDKPSDGHYVGTFLLALAVTAVAELIWLADKLFKVLSMQARAEDRSSDGDNRFEVVEPQSDSVTTSAVCLRAHR